MLARRSAACLLAALSLSCAHAAAHRDLRERAAFQREHPCPSTGRHRGACPGYVVDHIEPLCAGGPDRRTNMQWQSSNDALAKDRWENRLCRNLRAKGLP